jgi:hypothetical protein
MQRIVTVLQKLTELSTQGKLTQIDADLMLDYTRVLYADLLEERKKLAVENIIMPEHKTTVAPTTTAPEPAVVIPPTPTQPQEIIEAKNETSIETPQAIPVTPATAPHDIRTVIGINDKYLFITDLFKDDKAEYNHVIQHLNTFSNSTRALNWVKNEVAAKQGWDEENETVQSFYGLINSFFPSI